MKINELKNLLNENQEAFWNLIITSTDNDWSEETLNWLLEYVNNNSCPRFTKLNIL